MSWPFHNFPLDVPCLKQILLGKLSSFFTMFSTSRTSKIFCHPSSRQGGLSCVYSPLYLVKNLTLSSLGGLSRRSSKCFILSQKFNHLSLGWTFLLPSTCQHLAKKFQLFFLLGWGGLSRSLAICWADFKRFFPYASKPRRTF